MTSRLPPKSCRSANSSTRGPQSSEVITIYGILCLLLQGGITYGACTVHGRAGPPHGVPRFDQSHARRISAVGAALRGRVPSPYGGVAPRWEAPDGPPFQRVPELSLTDP